jgi:hypothetical protein
MWPALGEAWGSIENAAGGDTIQLVFTAPVTHVTVASTSNYQPGLTNPSGEAVPNYDVLGVTQASGASKTWTVLLPQWDVRAISGYTFSVVVQDEAGYHDYALMLKSPRFANEVTHCSESYYTTMFSQFSCTTSTVPPGGALRGVPQEDATGGKGSGGSGKSIDEHGSTPQLRVTRSWYVHRRLHMRIAVPSAGTLNITVVVHGRSKRTLELHSTSAGTVSCTAPISAERTRIRLTFHSETGTVTHTQTIAHK